MATQIEGDALRASLAVLEALPFPVLWVMPDYSVAWANSATERIFGPLTGRCHQICHHSDVPCPAMGADCAMMRAGVEGRGASVTQMHINGRGPELYRVTAVPVAGGGALEMHMPLEGLLARDLLTGLLSRSVTELAARRSFELMRRLDRPAAVLMVDLDHFKGINDRHGHAAGDTVLTAVGKCISANVRTADIAGRWGGEEFVVVLPGASVRGAREQADRILQEIRRLRIQHGEIALSVTASIGVWAGAPTLSVERAIESADAAMYRAKAAGRDRVEVSDPPPLVLSHSHTGPDEAKLQ